MHQSTAKRDSELGRRAYLKKAGAVGIGSLLLGSREVAAASRTTLAITEYQGKPLDYVFRVYDTDVQLESGFGNVDNSGTYGRGYGSLQGGEHVYSFQTQLRKVELTAHEPGKHYTEPSADVRLSAARGWGFTGNAAIDTWTEESLGVDQSTTYDFCLHDGNVNFPGDGTVEDVRQQEGIYNNNDCAYGVVSGGHDHWDTTGRIEKLRVVMYGPFHYHFKRYRNYSW